MSSKFIRYFLVTLIAVILLAGVFTGGVLVGWAMPGSVATILPMPGADGQPTATSQGASTNLDQLFAPFWEACWGGVDLRQTLILWNDDVTNWVGNVWGQGPGVKNAFFYQVYGGYKWDKFNFFASLAYAKADEAWGGAYGAYYELADDDYGWELDVTATYSITNNLKYMVGAGYLWTGDYFKFKPKHGTGSYHDTDDIYLITNKLTLTF